MPDKEKLSSKEIKSDKKTTNESLQDLKNEILGVVRYSSFPEIVKNIPQQWTDKKVYQCLLGNSILNFYGNGRVGIIRPGKSVPEMHNWKKENTTIYIDNKPIDLEKAKYKWEDKETDNYMEKIAGLYIAEVHKRNPQVKLTDDQLRDRFYNLFRNRPDKQFKIRDLSEHKPWFLTKASAKLLNRPEYAEGKVAHYAPGTMYIHKNTDSFHEVIAEMSHHFNKDSTIETIIFYGIDLVQAGFDQSALYSKPGSIEFLAHSVTENAINSYLMLSPDDELTKNESFDTVWNNYFNMLWKVYGVDKKYDVGLTPILFNNIHPVSYAWIKDAKRVDDILVKIQKDILSIKDVSPVLLKDQLRSLITHIFFQKTPDIDEEFRHAAAVINNSVRRKRKQ